MPDLFNPNPDPVPEPPGIDPDIHPSWKSLLADEFKKRYFIQIKELLMEEKNRGNLIFPPGPLIFNAFNQCPVDAVKVVILGQDPYHGHGQAHGLCFSVPNEVPPPPSLINIFREIESDLEIPMPAHGNLEKWATQGVFLLNAILTVKANQPASHRGFGWEDFTDAVIKEISEHCEAVVFLLWGKFAQEKSLLVDMNKHNVLMAAHPSPYSADKGFFGCRHFSKCNQWLENKGLTPIDWGLL